MRNNNDIKVIGLTGGTGTGKSTVASILTEYGGIAIDADKTYKELIKKDNVVYRELINYFGNEIVGKNGEIDRGKLSDIVFNDKDKLNMLNRLTHKHVGDEIHRLVKQIKKIYQTKSRKPSFIVLDVPIPVEYGFLIWLISFCCCGKRRHKSGENYRQKRIDGAGGRIKDIFPNVKP